MSDLPNGPQPLVSTLSTLLFAPQPIERLATLRVFAPLAIVAFMSTRIAYADHWIGNAGLVVPDLGGDWRQPLYLPPLSAELSFVVGGVLAIAGLLTAVGAFTRPAALVFAASLAYVTLADRLSAFTVSKLSPMIAIVLAVSAAGAVYGIDAVRAGRPAAERPTHEPGGPVRFLQLFLPLFYCASGICKVYGDWLSRSDVLWTHLSDSYQTGVSHALANHLPAASWGVFQATTLAFELFAPLWFGWKKTRPFALAYAIAMHAMIGLMFGPVIWFSLLMITIAIAAYAPVPWLRRGLDALSARLSPLAGRLVGRR